MTTQVIEAVPLSSALGAAIHGVDLKHPLDERVQQFLRDTWSEHLVIVINQSDLSAEDQIRFCRVFGEISGRTRPKSTRNEPEDAPSDVMYISNLRENGKFIGSLPLGEMQFHIDQCYIERPSMGSSLYAIEVPHTGGDTKFSNLYRAFETLPGELKRAIAGRRATHVFESGDYGVLSRETHAHNENSPRATHPIVCTHPVTGRKSLFVNRIMTERIDGLPADESENLLGRLFDHMERPEFVYIHKWRVGDLLLWDNRCTSHARTDFDPNERRHLRRFTIRGTKPV